MHFVVLRARGLAAVRVSRDPYPPPRSSPGNRFPFPILTEGAESGLACSFVPRDHVALVSDQRPKGARLDEVTLKRGVVLRDRASEVELLEDFFDEHLLNVTPAPFCALASVRNGEPHAVGVARWFTPSAWARARLVNGDLDDVARHLRVHVLAEERERRFPDARLNVDELGGVAAWATTKRR